MIKRMAGYIGEYKKETICSPIFVCLEIVVECLIPLIMARLIDSGINAGNMRVIVMCGIAMLFCSLLGLLFGVLSGRYSAIASAGFSKNLRHDIYYKIQEFSFSNIDKFSTGGLITRLTTDVTNIQQAFMMIIRMAVRSPFSLIFSIIMALTISPKLTLIFVFAVPILAYSLFSISKKAHPMFQKVFNTYDTLNNVVQENLRGIRVVKSFVREDYEKEKFNSVSQSIFRDFTKVEKLLALNQPVMQTIVYACMILISWFGAKIVVNSGGTELSTGRLTSLFTYTL